jgi:hypothetical protein
MVSAGAVSNPAHPFHTPTPSLCGLCALCGEASWFLHGAAGKNSMTNAIYVLEINPHSLAFKNLLKHRKIL